MSNIFTKKRRPNIQALLLNYMFILSRTQSPVIPFNPPPKMHPGSSPGPSLLALSPRGKSPTLQASPRLSVPQALDAFETARRSTAFSAFQKHSHSWFLVRCPRNSLHMCCPCWSTFLPCTSYNLKPMFKIHFLEETKAQFAQTQRAPVTRPHSSMSLASL